MRFYSSNVGTILVHSIKKHFEKHISFIFLLTYKRYIYDIYDIYLKAAFLFIMMHENVHKNAFE